MSTRIIILYSLLSWPFVAWSQKDKNLPDYENPGIYRDVLPVIQSIDIDLQLIGIQLKDELSVSHSMHANKILKIYRGFSGKLERAILKKHFGLKYQYSFEATAFKTSMALAPKFIKMNLESCPSRYNFISLSNHSG